MKNYVAKCDNKINSICKFSEDEFKDWNGKCCYGKDGGVYCTAKFKEIEENNNKDMLEMKESEDVCLCIHCKNETTKKISIHFDNNNTASFSLCDNCLTKLTKEFINYYITNEN